MTLHVAPEGRSAQVKRLITFWQLWHTYGGQGGLIRAGCWSRASVYRLAAEFREVFGCDVAEFNPRRTR